MAEHLKDKIGRLLREGGEPGATEGQVRARLAADFSEALATGGPRAGTASPLTESPAAKAAFLDGRQDGPDQSAFAEELARDQSLRADLESASALLESIGEVPPLAPEDLVRRAGAQFMPDPGPRRAWILPRWEWQPRRRMAWAMVAAALTLFVLAPGAFLVVGDRLGWQAGEQPSASPQPEVDVPQSANEQSSAGVQADKETPACDDPAKRRAAEGQPPEPKAVTVESKDAQTAKPTPKDPCAPPAENENDDAPPPAAR